VDVEAAMRTPDGRWRVEIVRRGRTRWYRIVNGDNEIDWLSISAVERILAEAGVDMGSLQPVGEDDGPAADHLNGVA
jgi:bifunctional non-homologous end joining protein LigD